MKKTYLLTPGPTPIPESVLQAMNRPIPYHRSSGFQDLFQKVRTQLKQVYQTQQDVLVLTASGTGAMEAALTSLFQPGDAVLTINCGKFGERWTKLAQAFGLNATELKTERGQAPTLPEIESLAQGISGLKAILFQASETSTGVRLPTAEITKICQKMGILSVCDAITALGVFALPMDQLGIDVLITGSQKALMTPPGLSMVALSEKAIQKVNSNPGKNRFYFDLARELKQQAKNQTAWTPAITLMLGLEEALRIILAEGLENVFHRHHTLATLTRNAVQAMGLELLAKNSPSDAVTAVKVPAAITDGKQIPRMMRDQLGLTIAGGQDELEGKIFRLSHFGYCGPFDVLTGIGGLEITLSRLGYSFPVGAGVASVVQGLKTEEKVFQ